MIIEERIKTFVTLGEYLRTSSTALNEVMSLANTKNKWFTIDNIQRSIDSIVSAFLDEENLNSWTDQYTFRDSVKTIGVVAAGNIPLVAFHDVLCVLIAGHRLKIKLSEKGAVLLTFLLNKLIDIDSRFSDRIEIVDRLEQFDAVIATGSNNSARYFEYYFGKHPNIIRKNRNSIAVLAGDESIEELIQLGEDIFTYFGLGCRNVSKLWVPKDYNFKNFTKAISQYQSLMDHYHYKNNLDYNRTLLLMNQIPMLDIDFVNVVENKMIPSPISNIHYEFYDSLASVRNEIDLKKEEIQCIVGSIEALCNVDFGQAQSPGLADYADNIDTMSFLASLY